MFIDQQKQENKIRYFISARCIKREDQKILIDGENIKKQMEGML